jgi:hypothetical protein
MRFKNQSSHSFSLDGMHIRRDHSFPSYLFLENAMTAQNALSPNTLPAGQARTLRPQQAGVFRVTQGTAWATLDGPHAGHTQVQGDQFLQAGDTVHLQRGQRMVIEPVGAANTVCFSWVPAAQTAHGFAGVIFALRRPQDHTRCYTYSCQ